MLQPDLDSDDEPEEPHPLHYVRDDVLKMLGRFDLSGRVTLDGATVIGNGAYADVFRTQYITPEQVKVKVVVKQLRFFKSKDISRVFEKEIYVWSKLDHPNVLPLLGYTFHVSGYPLLVSERMTNGNSWDYVKNPKNLDCDLMRLIIGAAEGISYLHRMDVVHSDIKPENILVTKTGDALICDFGASRIAAASRSLAKPTIGLRGTVCYCAYELLALRKEYKSHTKESDVWSFGMTVFALLAQENPYAEFINDEHVVADCIKERILPILPPSINWSPRRLEVKDVFWGVCESCWDYNPKTRIIMDSIVMKLRGQ